MDNKTFIDWHKSVGLSQVKAAKLLGIPPSSLNRYIKRKGPVPLDLAVRIERYTGGVVPCASWVK